MNNYVQSVGPYLDTTAKELVDFVERFNTGEPIGSMASISLSGLTRVLESPEAVIDLLLLTIGNRCQNDDQLIALMAYVMSRAADQFQTPITAERLARAAEMLTNAHLALNQQPEDAP